MASTHLVTLFTLLAILQWVSITSGKQARTSAHSTLMHSANLPGHRLVQRSPSSHHGNPYYHGNQQRRGPVHALQASVHLPQAHDKPLVRRKRIRRDGSTPHVTGKETPALEQALASRHSTAHRLPSVQLHREKYESKAGHAGKLHRRRLVRRREHGHSQSSNQIRPDWRRPGHVRDRKTQRSVKRLGDKTEHQYKQTAHDQQRPLVSAMYRSRSRKMPVSQPVKRRLSDSTLDRVHARPLEVHHVNVIPRRRAPVSSSGERRRRPPVVQKSAGRLHRGGLEVDDWQSLKHGATMSSRHRGTGPRTRTNDRREKKSSSGGRSKRSRGARKLARSSRQITHPGSSTTRFRSSRPHLARTKRRRIVHG